MLLKQSHAVKHCTERRDLSSVPGVFTNIRLSPSRFLVLYQFAGNVDQSLQDHDKSMVKGKGEMVASNEKFHTESR